MMYHASVTLPGSRAASATLAGSPRTGDAANVSLAEENPANVTVVEGARQHQDFEGARQHQDPVRRTPRVLAVPRCAFTV